MNFRLIPFLIYLSTPYHAKQLMQITKPIGKTIVVDKIKLEKVKK